MSAAPTPVLGQATTVPITDPADLDTWPAPSGEVIAIRTQELTAVDPDTGRPAFYGLVIRYRPLFRIIESKSLKLWLWSFRGRKLTRADLGGEILRGLAGVLDAAELDVEVQDRAYFGVLPDPDGAGVTVQTDQITALCPVTGQPDYYDLTVSFRDVTEAQINADALLDYFAAFSETGIGVEALAARFRNDFHSSMYPDATAIRVTLTQYVRGGLEFTAEATFPATPGGQQ